MKFLLVVVFVGCIAFAASLTDEQREKMRLSKKECKEETGVSEELLQKAKEGVYEDDEKLKDFLVCFYKKPHLMDEAGHYQLDTIRTKMTDKYNAETAEKVITCIKDHHGTPQECALHLAKCFHEHVLKHQH